MGWKDWFGPGTAVDALAPPPMLPEEELRADHPLVLLSSKVADVHERLDAVERTLDGLDRRIAELA